MRSHEFSRTVQALDIGEDGLKLSLSAENDECDLLARRFGLIGIRRLAAEVCLLQRTNDDERIYLDGYLSADFVYNSVISLRLHLQNQPLRSSTTLEQYQPYS